jgi:hypothetical protein
MNVVFVEFSETLDTVLISMVLTNFFCARGEEMYTQKQPLRESEGLYTPPHPNFQKIHAQNEGFIYGMLFLETSTPMFSHVFGFQKPPSPPPKSPRRSFFFWRTEQNKCVIKKQAIRRAGGFIYLLSPLIPPLIPSDSTCTNPCSRSTTFFDTSLTTTNLYA